MFLANLVKRAKSHSSPCSHPARSEDRTAGFLSAVWWCWGSDRRRRCRIPRTGSLARAPGQSSPPSTPGGHVSARPVRTLGDVLPCCQRGMLPREVSFCYGKWHLPCRGKMIKWRHSPNHWCSVCFPPNEEDENEEEDALVVNQRFVSLPAVSESLTFARRKLVSVKQQLWDTDNGHRKQLWVLSCPPGVSASGI